MDGLFGLQRKKSAGHRHREPLHGHLWFSNQLEEDEFVAEYQHTTGRNDVRNYLFSYITSMNPCSGLQQLFIAASKSLIRKYGYCDKLFCLVCRTKPVEDYVLSHTSYLLRLTVNYTHIIFCMVLQ